MKTKTMQAVDGVGQCASAGRGCKTGICPLWKMQLKRKKF